VTCALTRDSYWNLGQGAPSRGIGETRAVRRSTGPRDGCGRRGRFEDIALRLEPAHVPYVTSQRAGRSCTRGTHRVAPT
jgi:hypothetical protein